MTLVVPPIWQADQYIRPIDKAPDGITAYTHLAEVRSPEGKTLRAYVKHFGAGARQGLFNEYLAYSVMSMLGVPQPQGAVMPAPVFGAPGTPVAWAFISCQPLPTFEGTPKQLYNIADPKQHVELVKRLLACTALPLLVAADQLVGNGDRNIGNLVFTGKSSFVAIDHGHILGGPDWEMGQLFFTPKWATSKLIEGLTDIDKLPKSTKSAILGASSVVEDEFYAQQLVLKTALDAASDANMSVALDCLWWRCQLLAEWFKDRLQLVV